MTTMLKPGTLVSLKTTLEGGVSYRRKDLKTGMTEEQLAKKAKKTGTPIPEVTKWETTRIIDDPAEYEAATKARSKARGCVTAVCAKTSFGLICPEGSEAELDAAIVEARKVIEEHHQGAKCTQIGIYVLMGRIAATDQEAVRAVTQELRSLLVDINAGVDRLDPKAIRDAANRAQEMSRMLTPEAAGKIGDAVKAARKAARVIVSRIEKKGDKAAVVLKDIQRGAFENARIAMLDLSETEAPVSAEDATPEIALGRVAGLDLDLAANGDGE